jgi:hypothetical protein
MILLEHEAPRPDLSCMISVKHVEDDQWMVTVKGRTTTHHRVRVTPADLERFAQGRSARELIEESFRFLLERESNTSILGSFDLPVIGQYFPEYKQEIGQRLKRA